MLTQTNTKQFSSETSKEEKKFLKPGLDGRILLKWVFKNNVRA
jgi:hypothetical protein